MAQASPEIAPMVRQYIDRYPVEHCFETPNLHVMDELLRPFGQKIEEMKAEIAREKERLQAAK